MMRLFTNLSSPEQLTHVVWTQTSFLGDIILATGAIAAARRHFPQAKHVLITTPIGKSVLEDEPLLDQIVVFDKRSKRGFLNAMRRVKNELRSIPRATAVHLQAHRSFRSSLLSRYLGLTTITYRQSDWSQLADIKVERIACFHEAARIGLLLEPLGIPREEIIALKPQLARQKKEANDLLIGIAPGSVWGTKRWPKESFAELAENLLAKYPAGRVVLLGSQDEKIQADFIAARLSPHRVDNLAGRTSLTGLKKTIAQLDVLFANDSSPIHFASAYNIPTVAVFGATVPQLGFGPLSEHAAVAEIALPCRPCSDHGPQVCPLGHFKCMREVSAARVLELGTQVLDGA